MKIEKGGPLVTALVIILLCTAYIIIPSALFEVKYIGYCMGWGFLFSMLTYGAYEINRTVRIKLEFSHLFGSGFVGFCLSALAYIAFASIKQRDMIDLARCASMIAAYFAIIYIVEKILTTRKENKAETEKREIIIERNKPKVGWTYTSIENLYTNDRNKTIAFLNKTIWIVTAIDNKRVHLQDAMHNYRETTESIYDFPFKYRPIYNPIDFDLLRRHECIKDELEDQIEIIKDILENKGKD